MVTLTIPPSALSGIFPARGEITGAISFHRLCSAVGKIMSGVNLLRDVTPAISPLAGEMSQRDRGGYLF